MTNERLWIWRDYLGQIHAAETALTAGSGAVEYVRAGRTVEPEVPLAFIEEHDLHERCCAVNGEISYPCDCVRSTLNRRAEPNGDACAKLREFLQKQPPTREEWIKAVGGDKHLPTMALADRRYEEGFADGAIQAYGYILDHFIAQNR